MEAALYYEAHITIDPVPEDGRPAVQALGDPWHFKLAKLLMQKGQPSDIDTFMTGHGKDLGDMRRRVTGMVIDLQRHGYQVRRYKVEDTVFDSRTRDVLGLLGPNGDEEVGNCRWCGERGLGFRDSPMPSHYCGHDPAQVRKQPSFHAPGAPA